MRIANVFARLALIAAFVTFLSTGIAGKANASGPDFEVVQYNMCSRACTNHNDPGWTQPIGSGPTSDGIVTGVEVKNAVMARPRTRAISLNEVCNDGAYYLFLSLPSSQFAGDFLLSRTFPGAKTCSQFGNLLFVKSSNPAYSASTLSTYYYNGAAGASSTHENRNALCMTSLIGGQSLVACSSHILGSDLSQQNDYHSIANSYNGRAREWRWVI